MRPPPAIIYHIVTHSATRKLKTRISFQITARFPPFCTLWKKVDFSLMSCKKSTILHSKWTHLKSCCFFLISLRSIINLAHDFKCPFLYIEITISNSTIAFSCLFYFSCPARTARTARPARPARTSKHHL